MLWGDVVNREDEVIKELCKIASEIGEHLKHAVPHDCFCINKSHDYSFRFDDDILEFIENAVKDKIKSEVT